MEVHHLGINKFIVTRKDLGISTVLGSCVSVCLYDSVSMIGGMNHYMLPRCFPGREDDPLRYGDTAVPLLIRRIRQAGGLNLKAKIFGGAQIFDIGKALGISNDNILIAREVLQKYQIEIELEDVGGRHGRVVKFYPHVGSILVRKCQGKASI